MSSLRSAGVQSVAAGVEEFPPLPLVLGERRAVRSAQLASRRFMIPPQQHRAEPMVVRAIPEPLLPVERRHAAALELPQHPQGDGSVDGIDLADADDEAVSPQVAAAELVAVPAGPEHRDPVVVRLDLPRLIGQVDADHLTRDRVLVLHARVADPAVGDAEVLFEHPQQFTVGHAGLLDAEVEVFPLAAGFVGRDLLDEEVLRARLDPTTDASGIGVGDVADRKR